MELAGSLFTSFMRYPPISKFSQISALFIGASVVALTFWFPAAGGSESIGGDSALLRQTAPDLMRAYDKVNLFDAWDYLVSKVPSLLSMVTIGILDTGVDASHPEFTGINFGSSSPFMLQDHAAEEGHPEGHGTAVAGIIGANNISALSSEDYQFPQMNGFISGITNSSYAIESRTKNFLTQIGLGIVFDSLPRDTIANLSFSSTKCSEAPFLLRRGCTKDADFEGVTQLYREVFSKHDDKTIIVAAGNAGVDGQFQVPANIDLPNVISVAATELSDQRADFGFLRGSSNFGVGVDISAPGKNVYTPAIRGRGNFPTDSTSSRDYIIDFSGTSASASLVTGVAAILKALKSELTPAEIKRILIETADPIQTGELDKRLGTGCYQNPSDPIYTGCRLNALNAVKRILPSTCPSSVREIFYDDGLTSAFEARNPTMGDFVLFNEFTPECPVTILKAKIFLSAPSFQPLDPVLLHIWDAQKRDLITPIFVYPTLTEPSWVIVDISNLNINVDQPFFVGVSWPEVESGRISQTYIGLDLDDPDDKSFLGDFRDRTLIGPITNFDVMIRVVVQ